MLSLQGTCGYLPMYVASFNGVDGYVKVPDSASLRPNTISIEFWLFLRDATSTYGQTYICKRNAANNAGYFVTSAPNTANVQWGLYLPTWTYLNSPSFTLNEWHHIVCTYNGSVMRIYVDLSLTEKVVQATITHSTEPLTIMGNDPAGYGRYTNGIIANVQIYNTALSQQEIQYLYQQGIGGGPIHLQNLVGWWPLNGDAKDYSGNLNHGTIYGGVSFVQNYNPP
jgi:hypothetical protein